MESEKQHGHHARKRAVAVRVAADESAPGQPGERLAVRTVSHQFERRALARAERRNWRAASVGASGGLSDEHGFVRVRREEFDHGLLSTELWKRA
jgi:hypothetical protein